MITTRTCNGSPISETYLNSFYVDVKRKKNGDKKYKVTFYNGWIWTVCLSDAPKRKRLRGGCNTRRATRPFESSLPSSRSVGDKIHSTLSLNQRPRIGWLRLWLDKKFEISHFALRHKTKRKPFSNFNCIFALCKVISHVPIVVVFLRGRLDAIFGAASDFNRISHWKVKLTGHGRTWNRLQKRENGRPRTCVCLSDCLSDFVLHQVEKRSL